MGLSVELNGQKKVFESLAEGASLQELIAALELKGDRIAVERNGTIVPRDERVKTCLGNGDRLEIVHFVGGGTRSLPRLSRTAA